MIPARVHLATIGSAIVDRAGNSWSLRPQGRLVPQACVALDDLAAAVRKAGGKFALNQIWRSHEEQVALRTKYEAGTGAAAQRPGTSAHQGGRAIDVSTTTIAFPVAADQQIDRLWELAKPLGWRPCIDRPDETASERWHLDFWSDWEPVRARRGYTEAAMCAVLDIGEAGQATKAWGADGALTRCVQAHLHRTGFDCGAIDGAWGARSMAAAKAAGLTGDRAQMAKDAIRLASSTTTKWS